MELLGEIERGKSTGAIYQREFVSEIGGVILGEPELKR